MLADPAVNPTPPRRGFRRWAIAAVVGWAVLLSALAYLSAVRDEPTVREQRDIEQALGQVSTAVGQLVAAVGPGVVVEIGPVEVAHGCRITSVRRGAVGRTEVTLYPPPGQAPAVLDRVAAALPAGYRAQVFRPGDGAAPTLDAEAPEFVGVRGRISPDGVVTLGAATGCRPAPPGFAEVKPAIGIGPDPAQQRVLTVLGVTAVSGVDDMRGAPCPAGGAARTLVLSVPPGRVDVAEALKPVLADATVLWAGPDRYAYLTGSTSVVVEPTGGAVRIAATTGCPARAGQ
jgi:hypothetical protein